MNTPRRLGWALHAFPRRFRAQRSSEIEATFHEAELAGDTHAFGLVALLDVVLAGWHERARTRPPLGQYLKYRLLGGRLAPRWHTWLFDDLDGWFTVRRSAWIATPLVIIMIVGLRATDGQMPLPPALFWVVWVIAMGLGGRRDRRRILKRNGYDPRTRTWVPPTVMHWVPMPLRIRRAAPMLTGVGVALLVVMPAVMIALLLPAHSVRSFTIGSSSSERVVDHTAAFGLGAVAVGVFALVLGLTNRRWIAARTLVSADAVDPTVYVVVPAGHAGWFVPASVAAVGIVTGLLPIAPLAVPAVFLAAGLASPILFVLAHTARQLERDGGGVVGLSTAPGAAGARLTRR